MDTTKERKSKTIDFFKTRCDPTFWGMAAALFLCWIVITGSLHYEQVLFGLICSFGVALFNNDLFLRAEERPLLNFRNIVRSLKYVLQLIVAIFIANLQVAAIVLNPRMPISPGLVQYKVGVKKSLTKVILGNSITLTPGTLTVHVEDDIFLVHALTEQNAENVVRWELADELARAEGE